jgi:lysophospholipase L1-like esterase
MITLGLDLNAAVRLPLAEGGPVPPPPPPPPPPSPPVINTIAIEGDSITATALAYHTETQAAFPAAQWTNHAVGGSNIGDPSDAAGTSSLWGRIDAVVAGAPDLLTVFIGANDLTRSDWITHLIGYTDEVRLRLPGVLIMVATPLPQAAPTGSPAVNAIRPSIIAQIHAQSGAAFDGIIPLGDHPIMGANDAAENSALYPDGLHPSGEGHDLIAPVFEAAIGALIEQNTGTVPDSFAFTDLNNAPAGSTETSMVVVSGLGLGESVSASVTGTGDAKLGTGEYATSLSGIINGMVVTSRVTASGEPEGALDHVLDIAGISDTWTITTASAAIPASFVALPSQTVTNGFTPTPNVFTVDFPAGRPVIGLHRNIAVNSVSVGGAPCTQAAAISSGNPQQSIWICDAELPAGEHTVETQGSNNNLATIFPGVLTNVSSSTAQSSGTLPYVYRAGPEDQGLDQSVAIPSGGIGLLLAYSATGYDDAYTNTLAYEYDPAGWRWFTFTASGTADLRVTGYGFSAMLGASLA